MNKDFNKQQIAQIAVKTRQFKKLYVTTEGQMFVNEPDAEEAVRVKNMIIDEPEDYVGIIELTEEQVSDEALKKFAKNPDEFGKLFDDAKIPRMKDAKKDKHERKREAVTPDDGTLADVSAALGLGDKTETTTVSANETKAEETKKITPVSSALPTNK